MAEPALAYSPPPCPALDAILALDEDSLPYTDGKPMADARQQQEPLHYSREGIRRHLRDKRDRIAVDGDMFVYYVGQDDCGKPVKRSLAPDVFVVFGVPDRRDRKSYVLWDEPEADIRFVLEIASTSTRTHDHTEKRQIYESLGVREYFLFDPPSRRRPAALLGLRLRNGVYRKIRTRMLPGGGPGVPSNVVGLTGHVDDDGRLRWFDPVAGKDLLYLDEYADRLVTEAQRADAEARRTAVEAQRADENQRQREAAERRVAELEALLRAKSPP